MKQTNLIPTTLIQEFRGLLISKKLKHIRFLISIGIFSLLIPACAGFKENHMQTATAPQVFMAGDSTMAIKEPSAYPETGWGVPFATFFNDSTKVVNLAKNGRSTRTFISEGLWQQVTNNLHAGDYVFIQFGHNDEVPSKVDRYTTSEQYQANLNSFIQDVEQAQANVILMTPVIRRKFGNDGKLTPTHPYAQLVREVALEHPEIVFIDMQKITHDYFEAMSPEASALRFMHLEPGLNPNYPDGRSDDTHYNELGAREAAQLVLLELKRINHPVVQLIRPADPKHLKK